MDFSEIEQSVRQTLDDNSTTDKLWSQADILEYAVDAENEACERAELIIDNTTAVDLDGVFLCFFAILGSVAPVSPLIIDIKSVRTENTTEPLMRTSMKILDNTVPDWRTHTGVPRSYMLWPTNNITFYPAKAFDVVSMTVSRFPLAPITTTTSPEIDARYHPGLLYWILNRAFSKNDSETLDVEKAKEYEKKFEKFFGPKKILSD